MRIIRIFSRLFLLTLGFFLALAFAELAVRFYLKQTRVISDEGCRQEDNLLHHSLIPKSICRSKTKEWNIEFKVNSLGLRDYEYSKDKPEGVYRILMLGDSFTEGYGVSLEETFSKILEKKLNSEFKNKFEVINAGITGYSPTLEYLYLENYGLKLRPDLVILNFSMTDFYDDLVFKRKLLVVEKDLGEVKMGEKQIWAKGKLFKEKIPGFTIPPTTWIPFIPTSLKWWLHKNLVSYDFVVLRLKKIFNPQVYKENIISFTASDPQTDQFAITRENINSDDYQKLLQNSEGVILKIKNLLEKEEINFILVIIPYGQQINGQEWGEGRKLWEFAKGKVYSSQCIADMANFTQKQEIRTLNLLSTFQKARRFFLGRFYYYSYDGHWNEKGHKLAAQGIFDFLKNEEFLE